MLNEKKSSVKCFSAYLLIIMRYQSAELILNDRLVYFYFLCRVLHRALFLASWKHTFVDTTRRVVYW